MAHAAGLATSPPVGWSFTNINLAQVPVFVGALLGAMLTYSVQFDGDQSCGTYGTDGGEGRARAVQARIPGIMAGNFEARLRSLREHRDRGPL